MTIETVSNARTTVAPRLTILILTLNEAENLRILIPQIRQAVTMVCQSYEIVVIDAHSADGTAAVASHLGARVIMQHGDGYGAAFREGLEHARGEFTVTLDADLSHDAAFIPILWDKRHDADLIVASRFCKGGATRGPRVRGIFSRWLGRIYSISLRIPVFDVSSGFRFYRTNCVRHLVLHGKNFDILEEILAKMYMTGCRIVEVPFTYLPRTHGSSKAKIVRICLRLLLTLIGLLIEKAVACP
jgi:glycosyltransferase involved in cell wall biosynthesis